jgi:hypothetical protein
VSAPDFPTFTSIERTRVVAWRAANFTAMAQRG